MDRMNKNPELYTILKEMVYFAQLGDKDKVLELNKNFEEINEKICPLSPAHEVCLDYDNCRQSCVFSVMMDEERDKFLEDAKERFAKIQLPS